MYVCVFTDEIYLMRDSCLCDACYRHVDRRLNSTSYNSSKNYKRSNVLATIPRPNHCHVLGCDRESSHVLRRKWLMKMRKSVSRVVSANYNYFTHDRKSFVTHTIQYRYGIVTNKCESDL